MTDTTAVRLGALAWMREHVNLAEQPWGSNRVPVDGSTLWELLGLPAYNHNGTGGLGQPWCAGSATYAYLRQGVDLRKHHGTTGAMYCPAIEATARRLGTWRTSGGSAGDLVLYGTGGIAIHVGIAAPAPGALYYAYEGNTSPGNKGSQANGGGLYYRGRPRSFIRGWVDMAATLEHMRAAGTWTPGTPHTVTAARAGSLAATAPRAGSTAATATKAAPTEYMTRKHANDARAELVWGGFPLEAGHWYGADDGSARSHSGARAQDARAVRQIQRTVGVPADGEYGPATRAAVIAWQTAHGITGKAADGEVGPSTWSRMAA